MSHLDSTHVVKWSGITFDRPVPLVPRRHLKPGDVVMSSHGYVLNITAVEWKSGWDVVHLVGAIGKAVRNEIYGGSIPLLQRDGVVFGTWTYDKPWPEVPPVPA